MIETVEQTDRVDYYTSGCACITVAFGALCDNDFCFTKTMEPCNFLYKSIYLLALGCVYSSQGSGDIKGYLTSVFVTLFLQQGESV